jgi:hypothetical protein
MSRFRVPTVMSSNCVWLGLDGTGRSHSCFYGALFDFGGDIGVGVAHGH